MLEIECMVADRKVDKIFLEFLYVLLQITVFWIVSPVRPVQNIKDTQVM